MFIHDPAINPTAKPKQLWRVPLMVLGGLVVFCMVPQLVAACVVIGVAVLVVRKYW